MHLVFTAVTLILLTFQVYAAEIGLNSTAVTDDIIASGQIVTGDANKVSSLMRKTVGDGKAHRFIIHSPGGNVTEAIAIGNLLRSNGFSVFEPPQVSCISACVFAIAGGTSRILMGKVGLHHPYLPNVLASNPAAIEVQTEGKQSMTAYMEKMGVKEEVVEVMYSIKDPEQIRYLDTQELRAYQLSTSK